MRFRCRMQPIDGRAVGSRPNSPRLAAVRSNLSHARIMTIHVELDALIDELDRQVSKLDGSRSRCDRTRLDETNGSAGGRPIEATPALAILVLVAWGFFIENRALAVGLDQSHVEAMPAMAKSCDWRWKTWVW